MVKFVRSGADCGHQKELEEHGPQILGKDIHVLSTCKGNKYNAKQQMKGYVVVVAIARVCKLLIEGLFITRVTNYMCTHRLTM